MSNTKSKVVNGERYHMGTVGNMSKAIAIGLGTTSKGVHFFEWEDDGTLTSDTDFVLAKKLVPWTMETIPKISLWVKLNDGYVLHSIKSIGKTEIRFSNVVATYKELLKNYKYLDSNGEMEPCGVLT